MGAGSKPTLLSTAQHGGRSAIAGTNLFEELQSDLAGDPAVLKPTPEPVGTHVIGAHELADALAAVVVRPLTGGTLGQEPALPGVRSQRDGPSATSRTGSSTPRSTPAPTFNNFCHDTGTNPDNLIDTLGQLPVLIHRQLRALHPPRAAID